MTTTKTQPTALAEFDRLNTEATYLAHRIADQLTNSEFPKGLHWGHVGDMAETVKGLRQIADRLFGEGEHAD